MRKIFLPFIALVVMTVISFSSQNKTPCANSITCAHNLSAMIENGAQGNFLGQTVTAPNIDQTKPTVVLGDESNPEPKHIYVDLEKQTLYAFQGNSLYLQTLVSSGKWGRTPAGEYKIWVKILSTRMAGGSGNDAYNLPNVPYVMFFYNDQVSKDRGYSLHGAYWHNNFGHEMSHGCVNLRAVDAKALYDWVTPATITSTTYASKEDPGTPISICNRIELSEKESPKCIE